MSGQETRPGFPSPEDDNPDLKPVDGDGPKIWSRPAEAWGLTAPITPQLFAGSNLMRKLQNVDRPDIKYVRGTVITTVIPRTKRSAIIGEIYRKTLPPEQKELVTDLESRAFEEEMAYDMESFSADLIHQVHLADVTKDHADSLLMQGFDAFAEAAYDFEGDMHQHLIRDAQLFAAHLIEVSGA